MAPTILVVDDSSLVRDVTSSILRGAGFEVIEGATGADALRLASRRPELIVLDVHLPDLDGREVCRQIKAHPATAAIPVLHLSGTFREVEDRVRGLELGADGYLTKPVGKAELLATVNALLRVRKVEADLGQSEGRRRTAEALVDVGRALAQSLDPGEVGQRITEGLRELFGAEVATLYRMEPESGNLVSVAMAGNAGSDGQGVVMPRGTGVSGLAVIGRTAVVTADATTDPRVTLSAETRARLERAPFRAVLAVPLLVQDRVIGALAVGDRAGRQFGPEDLRLAQAFATQAALALENARLYAQRAHAEEALRESQETLRAVIDAIPVMINAKDRDCRYVLMNSFQARIYGIAPEAAVGRTATELRGPVYGTYTEALDRQVLTSGAALPYFEES
jgi:CheY-like chemotaxis protein